mgnify:CR=1 FL=1
MPDSYKVLRAFADSRPSRQARVGQERTCLSLAKLPGMKLRGFYGS